MDSDMENEFILYVDSSSSMEDEEDGDDGNICKEGSGIISVEEASNDDFKTIITKYKSVKVLSIHSFIDCGIKYLTELYKLPKLRSISLSEGFNCSWAKSFANIKNYTLTSLSIDDIIMDFDIIACTKAFPNMRSFSCGKVTDHSFGMFQAMSKNWPKLESLSLELKEDEYVGSHGKDLVFPSLKYMHFDLVECNSMAQVFSHFKAPKLQELVVGFFQGNIKNIAPMNKNCPHLMKVRVCGRNNATAAEIKNMFPNATCSF